MLKAMSAFAMRLVMVSLFATVAAAANLEQPVVVRYNPQTGAVDQVTLKKEVASPSEAAAIAQAGDFRAVQAQNVALNELDREAGASSWYWYCSYCGYPNYGYNYLTYSPVYYYYGANYYPYYNYAYNGCYYYYYSGVRRHHHMGWWR